MKNSLKHLISFILPATVLVFVPISIEKDLTVKCQSSFIIGIILMMIGLFFLFSTL